jgi:hypothetical protein
MRCERSVKVAGKSHGSDPARPFRRLSWNYSTGLLPDHSGRSFHWYMRQRCFSRMVLKVLTQYPVAFLATCANTLGEPQPTSSSNPLVMSSVSTAQSDLRRAQENLYAKSREITATADRRRYSASRQGASDPMGDLISARRDAADQRELTRLQGEVTLAERKVEEAKTTEARSRESRSTGQSSRRQGYHR